MLSEDEAFKQITPELIKFNQRRKDLQSIWVIILDKSNNIFFVIRNKYKQNNRTRGNYDLYKISKEKEFLDDCIANSIPIIEANLFPMKEE